MTTEETPMTEETAPADPLEHAEAEDVSPGRLKRFGGRVQALLRGRMVSVLLGLLVVASAALAGGLLYFQYRPDRATDAAAAKSAITAATDGTIAILSYSPETLEADFASAKSHLTGDFLSYYNQFTQQIVAPAAKQKSVKTTAVVLRAAVSELHSDSAVVLEFVNQSTVSADRPEPSLSASSVLVTLTKADGKWLISSFDPV
ncbi:twin-arginine translocation pathway signal [Mycobacterium sp.]|uniref:twin-arginine translocation pathway signal n=1 Tax=Mycobacterium sp. TaxID=1785 RepID=UPI0031CE1DE8